jgi:hypothetical protein
VTGATRLGGLTAVLFAALVVAATHGRWVTGGSMTLLSASAVITPLVAVPTAVRVLAHPGPAAVPVNAARTTLTGIAAGLCAVLAGLLAVLGAIVLSPLPAPADSDLAVLLGLLAATAASLLLSARALARARILWTDAFERAVAMPGTSRPDLLDDAATLVARLAPGTLSARGFARVNRGLDDWAWSPRRHRTGFVVTTAGGAGAVVAGWNLVSGGWAADPFSPVLLGVVTSCLVGLALTAGITWLGLLRPLPE